MTLVLVGGSSGAEVEAAREQLDRFMAARPDIRVTYQSTPSTASERHTLYVTWLSGGMTSIDVLNLDVVWPPEFAAAGWLLPLDGVAQAMPDEADFAPGMLAASRHAGRLYALPWYLDAGLLYYRTDALARLGSRPPRTLAELLALAGRAREAGLPHGYLWQGAQYEGLTVNFLEFAWAHGGGISVEDGTRPAVATPANRAALTFMRSLIGPERASPPMVLTFLEEQGRLAFQQGQALFMRNWPYAFTLLNRPGSAVAGRFDAGPLVGVDGPIPGVLGGGVLAINRATRHPEAAWALVRFLTSPEAMAAYALRAGFAPARRSLYADPAFRRAAPLLGRLGDLLLRARPRPVTPAYAAISRALQVHVSRALTDQASADEALADAQAEIDAILRRYRPAGGSRG